MRSATTITASACLIAAACGRTGIAQARGGVLDLTATDAAIFWISTRYSNTWLEGVSIKGGPVRTYDSSASSAGWIVGFAVDGDRLVWSRLDGVFTMRTGESGPTRIAGEDPDSSHPFILDGEAFWIAIDPASQAYPNSYRLRSVKFDGSAPVTLLEGLPKVAYLVVDGTYFYWGDVWAAGVYRTPRAGGPIERLADTTSGVAPISLSATNIFFWNGLKALPKAGGPAVSIPDANVPGWVVDGNSLYVMHVDYVWPPEQDSTPTAYTTIEMFDAATLQRQGDMLKRQPDLNRFTVHRGHLYWADSEGTIHN